MKAKSLVLTGVGFVVGLGEALLFYNLGQAQGTGYKFKIPPRNELFKTAGVLALTSLLTTAIFVGIETIYGEEEQKLVAESPNTKSS